MNAKHTPGPWVARRFGRDVYVVDSIPDIDGMFVGNVIAGQLTCPDWETNARVIAAAPDLLSACKDALALLENPDASGFDADRVEARLREIISRASNG